MSSAALRAAKNEASKRSHYVSRRQQWFERHEKPPRLSANPPPTIEALRHAYEMRNDTCREMITLGSLLEDIEASCFVGYRYNYDRQWDFYEIDCYDCVWQTGLRGFLKEEPELLGKYKTLMRYKKLSADFRKAIGLKDPIPSAWIFDRPSDPTVEGVRHAANRILSGCKSFRELERRIMGM